MSAAALEIEGMSKSFGGVQALADVTFRVEPGEVHGLIGHNGAGKSTLIKIIAGYHMPDAGTADVWGLPVSFPVRSHQQLGIAVIHQDLALVQSMSVLENLGISSSFETRGLRPVSWARERIRCQELLERFDLDIDVAQSVSELQLATRAMIAILRAVRQLSTYGEQHLFLLDEPTAYLPKEEVARLMEMMRAIAASGSGVVFISHKLGEVLDVCDQVTVLRGGLKVGTISARESTQADLVSLMLGYDIGDFYPTKADTRSGDVLLAVEGMTGRTARDISFQLSAGEILGITGLTGMGQDELPYLIAGVHASPAASARVLLRGLEIKLTPRNALKHGVTLLPADRAKDGVWTAASALENITLPHLWTYFRNGLLDSRRQLGDTAELVSRFQVQPPDPTRTVAAFSGGNQQKIQLAKGLQAEPDVLLLHEPTQGVDAGARKEILELTKAAAGRGAGVAIFSSDFEQLAYLCERVLILTDGRITAALEGAEVTEDQILRACHAK